MYHRHFNSIESTQIYLKDNFDALKTLHQNILISCSRQTAGIGRKGNNWDFYPNSLAMSFTFKPAEIVSLTPLEIGILIINFLNKKLNKDLFLKWPNDIMDGDGKKCGGIICQYVDPSNVIVGIGLNWGKTGDPIHNDYRHALGSIDESLKLSDFDKEKISEELYNELLTNRIYYGLEIREEFNKKCFHLNKIVSITDNEKDQIGIFRGIGENGEALIEIERSLHPFLSGSLTFKG